MRGCFNFLNRLISIAFLFTLLLSASICRDSQAWNFRSCWELLATLRLNLRYGSNRSPTQWAELALASSENPQQKIWLLERLGRKDQAEAARSALRELLTDGKIKRVESGKDAPEIRGGHKEHVRKIVVFENGVRALWKPGSREGRVGRVDWKAEVSTYELAELYGFPVPMTVPREIDGVTGSLQILVPSMNTILEVMPKDSNGFPRHSSGPQMNEAIKALDYLTVQDDRNLENVLIPATGTLFAKAMAPHGFQVAIDHGGGFYPTARAEAEAQQEDLDKSPEQHDPGPEIISKIRSVPDSVILERLRPYQTEDYIRHVILFRRRLFLEAMDKLRNGSSSDAEQRNPG